MTGSRKQKGREKGASKGKRVSRSQSNSIHSNAPAGDVPAVAAGGQEVEERAAPYVATEAAVLSFRSEMEADEEEDKEPQSQKPKKRPKTYTHLSREQEDLMVEWVEWGTRT